MDESTIAAILKKEQKRKEYMREYHQRWRQTDKGKTAMAIANKKYRAKKRVGETPVKTP